MRRRRVAAAAITTALAGLAVGLGLGLSHHAKTVVSSCRVIGESTGNVYTMDPDQLLNASIIADVAMRRQLPDRAVIVALATAQQESKLRNLSYGDLDSVGLFQQRPSQGWGSPAQISNPVYAAGKFYDALVKVHRWQQLTVAAAAQAVQRSAFPDAYGSWEQRATALAAALTGETSGQLSCQLAQPGVAAAIASQAAYATADVATGTATDTALTASAASNPAADSGTSDPRSSGSADLAAATTAVTDDLSQDLGVTTTATTIGHKSATIAVSGLGATSSSDPTQRASTVAAWAIAHAAMHGITEVMIGDQQWQANQTGWRTTKHPAPAGNVSITLGR